jgi:hypothetical protein
VRFGKDRFSTLAMVFLSRNNQLRYDRAEDGLPQE